MEMPTTSRMAPRKYFLKAPEVCINRIIFFNYSRGCGRIYNYKPASGLSSGAEMPLIRFANRQDPLKVRGQATIQPAENGPDRLLKRINRRVIHSCGTDHR